MGGEHAGKDVLGQITGLRKKNRDQPKQDRSSNCSHAHQPKPAIELVGR